MTVDAFDADVLIYAAVPGHPLGAPVHTLFRRASAANQRAGVGSVLLYPELLSKPLRDDDTGAIHALGAFLGQLDLRPVDRTTAELASVLGANYRLRAADAIHLATAVNAGAERFITNNSKDFSPAITEIDITTPGDI